MPDYLIVNVEIAARFCESLAMTRKRTLCHCEERGKPVPAKAGEAISGLSTTLLPGTKGHRINRDRILTRNRRYM